MLDRTESRTAVAVPMALPRLLLSAMPLFPLQLLLDRAVRNVAQRYPELFARLGTDADKRFIIDAAELPFVLMLQPGPPARLEAHRRERVPRNDACISGTFLNLFDMVNGTLDGDALFFTRDLRISGDVQAVVRLRNALDDLDGSVIDTALDALGPLAGPARLGLSAIRAYRRSQHERH